MCFQLTQACSHRGRGGNKARGTGALKNIQPLTSETTTSHKRLINHLNNKTLEYPLQPPHPLLVSHRMSCTISSANETFMRRLLRRCFLAVLQMSRRTNNLTQNGLWIFLLLRVAENKGWKDACRITNHGAGKPHLIQNSDSRHPWFMSRLQSPRREIQTFPECRA